MSKTLLSIFTLLAFQICLSQSSTKYQRAKIWYSDAADFDRLGSLGIAMDHTIMKKNVFIISEFSESDLELVRQEGFRVDILIDDVKLHFLQQNSTSKAVLSQTDCPHTSGLNFPTPTNFNLGSMGGYLTYQEVLDELNAMHTLYPNLISAPQDINNFLTQGQPNNGVSPSIGNNGIKWVRISDNASVDEDEPEILYTSIHHAREPMSLMQNIYYMWYLLENYNSNNDIKGIVDNTELYFVPVVNPDGYLYNELTDPNGGGFWRKNRFNGNGVDNNRNYDYYENGNPSNGIWGGAGSSGNPNSEIYRGQSPISEVENQALKWLVEQHNFKIALNSHTFGNLLYYPFGYNGMPTPDETLFASIGEELTSTNNYTALRECCFSGDSDDFMYGTVGTHTPIIAYTPEVGTSFWMPASNIDPTCKEMMYQNLTAARMVSNFGKLVDTAPLFTGDQAQADANFEIQFYGVDAVNDFTVSLLPISSNIVTAGAPLTISNLANLQTTTGSISYQIDTSTNFGDAVIYDLVVNNGLYDTSYRIEKIFGQENQVFYDPGNSTSTNFNTNGWGTTTSVFVSPTSSITDSPAGNYDDNETKTITLNEPLDLTNAIEANVSFYALWEIETNFDYVGFQISVDNGNTWEFQCGNYTRTGSENQAIGEPIYDGFQNNWVYETVKLNDYLGQSVLARFILVTDNFVTEDGFYFDDLEFNILEPEDLDVNRVDKTMFHIFPNPIDKELVIDSSVSNYEISIYNILGQKLIERDANAKRISLNTSNWDSGVYLLKFKYQKQTITYKVVKP